jgi:hypothetical protein
VAVALLLLAQAWMPLAGTEGGPELGDDLVALSLATLQDGLEAGEIDPELPLPLTRIVGVFLDRGGTDIVLLGRREQQAAGVVPILPDDIALAMRSIWLSDQVPGMSIDPMVEDDAGDAPGPFQRVVYFGRLENTRAGLYAFRCDYWLKRLAAGAIPAPVPKLDRYVDLVGGPGSRSSRGNRFWFHPKTPEIQLTPKGDLMVFEDAGVELLTERDRSQFAGVRTHYLYMGRDPVAQHFAQTFTRRFDELASTYPDLVRLRNFFALAQVFGWIEQAGWAVGRARLESWEYLLHQYVPVPVHCPTRVPTVTTVFTRGPEEYRLAGGVSVEIRLPADPAIDTTGKLVGLASRLVQRDPRRGALSWSVDLPFPEAQAFQRLRQELAAGRSVGWLRRHAGRLGDVLGIEPMKGGGLAVLRRAPQGLQLAAVDREGVTALATGEDAGERFDEIAREICRSASDQDLTFIHVRKRGESFVFQVGAAQERFTPEEISALLEGQGAGSRLERLFLEAGTDFGIYRDGLAVARQGDAPGSAPPLDDPVRWAVALKRHFAGRLRFPVTDDPTRARRNLPKVTSPIAASDLVVVVRAGAGGDPPVSKGVLRSLELRGIRVVRSLEELADASHVLFVSGGTHDEVLDDLKALGRQGRLQGKLVILYAPHGAVGLDHAQDLIERYGMVGMVHHLREVEPALLEDALRRVDGVLGDAATEDARAGGDRLLGDALGRAAREMGTEALWAREVSKLQETILQI